MNCIISSKYLSRLSLGRLQKLIKFSIYLNIFINYLYRHTIFYVNKIAFSLFNSMEFLSTENRSTQEIETLSKIDQTLARSRKVIQESIELTRKSASRRAQFENRVHRS